MWGRPRLWLLEPALHQGDRLLLAVHGLLHSWRFGLAPEEPTHGRRQDQFDCVLSIGLTVAGVLAPGPGWVTSALTAGNTYLTVKTCVAA